MRAFRIVRVALVAALALLLGPFAIQAAATAPGANATATAAPPESRAGQPQLRDDSLPASVASVDDFVFDSFDAEYRLGRDGDGRSTLHTVEHLVAVFPDFDQNRGIRRALVEVYDGHRTHIEIVSVTDEQGTPRPYETTLNGDFLEVTIAVPQGQYVHGEQHYVIEYTQRDVTRYFEDTDDDEFYWDTNGTGWAQPFGSVSATVIVDESLHDAILDGREACYYGPAGSNERCELAVDGGVFQARVEDLSRYQNMTLVVAFAPGTFAPAPFDPFAFVPLPILIGAAMLLASIVLALILRFAVWRPEKGRGIVIAQYEPPEGVSPLLAANILGAKKRGFVAAIVDLAVQRNIRILERAQGRSTIFGVQRLSDHDLDHHERAVMSALFATSFLTHVPGLQSLASFGASPGTHPERDGAEVKWLQQRDTVLGRQVVNLTKSVALETQRLELRRKPPTLPIVLVGALGVIGTAVLLIAGIGAQTEIGIAAGVIGVNIGVWVLIGIITMLATHRPLTKAGAELREHLLGLREYIRLAEADRLQMLQSVSGAERVAGPAGDVIKIYERLLPYAVLFGLERQWAAELGKYYDETPPDWYNGSSGFHIATFSAGIGSLSSTVSTSYSGSSSSSSSGGSGGGGSSGGGGGGGGGGGV